jgi:hypothetical protein
MTSRRYLLVIAVTLLTAAVVLATLQLRIDPYRLAARAGDPEAARPALHRHERVSRAVELQRVCPHSIVFGSSRALHGIDPATIAVAAIEPPPYNFGLGSPSLRTLFDYLRMAHERCSLQRIVFGLDFPMFNGHKVDADRNYERFWSRPDRHSVVGELRRAVAFTELTYSVDTVRDILITARARWRGDPPLRTAQGQTTDTYYQGKTARLGGYGASFDHEISAYLSYLAPPAYAFDLPRGMAAFEEILSYVRREAIETDFVVLPVHAYEQAGIAMLGLGGSRDEWLRALAALFPAATVSPARLVNCMLHGTLETEEVPSAGSAGEMQYWWESSHFKRKAGAVVAAELRAPGGDTCRALDATSAEAQLRQVSDARRRWTERHSQDLVRVRTGVEASLLANRAVGKVRLQVP